MFGAAVVMAVLVVAVASVQAATVTWNKGNDGAGNKFYRLNDSANWTGGVPANGSNVFLVFTRTAGANNDNKTVTNANVLADQFFADSLNITNASNKDNVFIYFKAGAFFTNGIGQLNYAGASDNKAISLTFSNTLAFKLLNFSGSGGSGQATLVLAGPASGGSLNFTGSGNNALLVKGGLNLTGNLTVSGGNANNTVLIASNTTVAGRLAVAGNITDPYFSLTNAMLTVSNGVANTGRIDLLNQATLYSVRDWTNNGVLNLAGNATLLGGTLTNQANGTITGSGFIKTSLVNQGRVDFGGVVSNNLLQTAGTFTLSAAATITGTTTINGGTLTLFAHRLTSPQFIIGASGNVFSPATGAPAAHRGATLNGAVTNAGSVFFGRDAYVTGLLVNSGHWTQAGGVSNDVVNTGTMTFQRDNVALHITGGIINSGVLTFDADDPVTVGGSVTNSGTFAFHGSIAGSLVQNSGQFTGSGTIAGALVNTSGSTITISGGGSLALTASPHQTGAVKILGHLSVVPAWTNSAPGTIELLGGKLTGGTLANLGTLTGSGTISAAVVNNPTGLIRVDSGQLVMDGPFTNSGMVTMTNSVAIFKGPVINAGAWVTDPTTNTFHITFTITSSGYVAMTAGDVFVFSTNNLGGAAVADFVNLSSASNLFNTVASAFVFENSTLSLTQRFFTAGNNIGSLDSDGGFDPVMVTGASPLSLAQYQQNFALGTLRVNDLATLLVSDAFPVGGRSHGALQSALFLLDLNLGPTASLVISNNVQVYYFTSNGFSAGQVSLLGNAGLHQIFLVPAAVVPEPHVIFLLGTGLVMISLGRRSRDNRA